MQKEKRAWKENEGGEENTTWSWRGQRRGATQRVPLPTEHTQRVKRVKVKFEIRHRGSKSSFHKAETMGFMPSASHGH